MSQLLMCLYPPQSVTNKLVCPSLPKIFVKMSNLGDDTPPTCAIFYCSMASRGQGLTKSHICNLIIVNETPIETPSPNIPLELPTLGIPAKAFFVILPFQQWPVLTPDSHWGQTIFFLKCLVYIFLKSALKIW